MAHPKRQNSKQRGNKRRTHQGVSIPVMSTCSNCKKPILPHRVCPFCGQYKGKPVVDIKPKKEKEKKQ